MTWIHVPNSTKSTYLPGEEAGYSPPNISSNGAQSAMSSGQITRKTYSKPELRTVQYKMLPFGMMLPHSTGCPGVDTWILSLEGSRVSRSQLQERKKQETTLETDGLTLLGSLVKCPPNMSGLKTSQGYSAQWITPRVSLWGISEPFSETWPKWGMMQNGVVYQLKRPGLLINEIGSGFGQPNRWATPNTMDTLPPKSEAAINREMTESRPGRSKPANLRDQVANGHLWPSPSAKEPGWRHLEPVDKEGNKPQSINERWYDKDTGRLIQKGLRQAVMYSTPMKPTRSGNIRDCFMGQNGREKMGKALGVDVAKYYLNPEWVAWLMGWPIGWTSLEPIPHENIIDWLEKTRAGEWWEVDPADIGQMNRVQEEREEHHKGRVSALGNGQVPASVWLAHKTLLQ